jgi:translation initiation factor IF-2
MKMLGIVPMKKLPEIGQTIGKPEEPQVQTAPVIIAPRQSLSRKENKQESKDQLSDEQEEEEKQTVKIILKTDVVGTLQAITSNLSEEVEVIDKGVGDVSESDVLLAQATGANIIAFNSGISNSAQKLAQIEKVKIKTYKIIYKLFEDLEKKVLKILEPTIDEEELGRAAVIAEFTIKGTRIAGCQVESGEISRTSSVHLKREDQIIADAKIKTLKTGKQEVDKVKAGNQCGISFNKKIDFQVNDVIISYRNIDKDK